MIANSQIRVLCFSVLLFVVLPDWTEAVAWQPPPNPVMDLDSDSEEESAESGFFKFAQSLYTDRKTVLTVQSFRQDIQTDDVSKALNELARLQTADPLFQVPMANGAWGPLFLNVLRDFELLPASAQQKLNDQVSGAARRRLNEILAHHDFDLLLPEFFLKYAGTEESFQALILISRVQVDRGLHRSAAIWLDVVAKSSQSQYAALAKQQLALLRVDEVNRVSDSTANVDSPPNSAAVIPEFTVWDFRSPMSPILEAQIDAFRDLASQESVTPTSSWEPALDTGRAYQRTMRGVAAIDLDSGSAVWHYPIAPPLDQKLVKNRSHSSLFSRILQKNTAGISYFSIDKSMLASLFCRDEVQTRPVVSNGRVLVVAPDVASTPMSAQIGRVFLGSSGFTAGFHSGQLIALDAESGRRIWTVGHAALEQELGPTDGVAWFYGAPRVVNQAVLCVFEWNGEIRLGRFSIATGQYLSSALISIPEQTVSKDPVRSHWACTPIRDSGLLWTTTSTGWLQCLDETSLSVLWATCLADESSLRATSSVRRARFTALTSAAQLNRRWNHSRLKLVGDRLLVLCQEAYEAVLVDSQTGQRVKTIPVSNATFVYADEHVFVLADRDLLQCFSIQDGREIWKRKMHDTTHSGSPVPGVVPTGSGVRHKGNLLFPLSNGHLATLDLDSGAVQQGENELLPLNGWGHLISGDQDRLLYVSGDQVMLLSDTAATVLARNHLQLSREFLANGDLESALREAKLVVESDSDFQVAQDVAFQCLLQLAGRQPDLYLDQLKVEAKTSSQQAEQRVVETQLLMAADRSGEAISMVCELLKMQDSIIHVPLRSVALKTVAHVSSSAPELDRGAEQIQLTIRAWATATLTDLLSEVVSRDWPVDDLQSIPKSQLLGIKSPVAAKFVAEQVGECETRQLAFELLQHAVKLKSKSDDSNGIDYQDEIQILDDFLGQVVSEHEPILSIPLDVQQTLLSTAIAEFPSSFVEAVQSAGVFEKWSLTWPDKIHEQLLQQETERYQAWGSTDWSAIPIRNRSASFAFRGGVSVFDQNDPFLNQYRWRLVPGRPGRLFSYPFFAPKPWNWNLVFCDSIVYGDAAVEWVERSGTVLLLRSVKSLTAISLLEREVLWSLPIPRSSAASPESSFRDRLDLEARRLQDGASPSWRLLSASDGCICVAEGNQRQVYDLFTGRLLWQTSLTSDEFSVISGPGSTLLFHDDVHPPLLVDMATGEFRVEKSLDLKHQSVIHQNDSQIVIWDEQSANAPKLMWMDLGQIADENFEQPAALKTVELKQFESFQFLNATTLAAIHSSGKLQTIDLNSGASQDYQVPFSKSEFPPKPEGLFLAGNHEFLYVGFPASTGKVPHSGFIPSMVEFEKELFVLDRKTGAVSAKIETEKSGVLHFQDSRFPMLFVATLPNQESGRGPLRVQCYSIDGKQCRFEGDFPFRSALKTLNYKITGLQAFDFVVNETSFRIEAVHPVSILDSDE